MKSSLLNIHHNSLMTLFRALHLLLALALPASAMLTLSSRTFAQCAFEWKSSEGMPALNGDVLATTVWDDGSGPALYVAGSFTTAGDLTVNRIARWDGTSWSSLGSGITVGINAPFVSALSVYNGELIVGGYFTDAGGVSSSNIARWNGTNWLPLGSGTNGNQLEDLIVYNGELIAAGSFSSAGGVNAAKIARWNGTSWSSLGSGMSNTVFSLGVYNNELIAGGSFTTAGGVSANRIARWNGTSWSTLGAGVDGPVAALTVYKSKLIAMGSFISAGGSFVNYIASWDGISWSPLGTGLVKQAGTPFSGALTVYNGELIATGPFNSAGGVSANYIAKWNETNWSALGSGTNHRSHALSIYRGELIAGGLFTIAGGNPSPYLARWGPTNNNTSDLDGDGVLDNCDNCPGTIPGLEVDAEGCPLVISGDFDRDGDVDANDFDRFIACASGPQVPYSMGNLPPGCDLPDIGGILAADFDADTDVDMSDFGLFQRCMSGENVPGDSNCAAH